MWSNDKIDSKRAYFQKQRVNPTGRFTEFVVRTFYCIYNQCLLGQDIMCPTNQVSNKKISLSVYGGLGDNTPDHDYYNVINDCKNHLINMGYIHIENHSNIEYYVIDKHLDFLLPGEHEHYLNLLHSSKTKKDT